MLGVLVSTVLLGAGTLAISDAALLISPECLWLADEAEVALLLFVPIDILLHDVCDKICQCGTRCLQIWFDIHKELSCNSSKLHSKDRSSISFLQDPSRLTPQFVCALVPALTAVESQRHSKHDHRHNLYAVTFGYSPTCRKCSSSRESLGQYHRVLVRSFTLLA